MSKTDMCSKTEPQWGEELWLFCSLLYSQCPTNICWLNECHDSNARPKELQSALEIQKWGEEFWPGSMRNASWRCLHLVWALKGQLNLDRLRWEGRYSHKQRQQGQKHWPAHGSHIKETWEMWVGWRLGCVIPKLGSIVWVTIHAGVPKKFQFIPVVDQWTPINYFQKCPGLEDTSCAHSIYSEKWGHKDILGQD